MEDVTEIHAVLSSNETLHVYVYVYGHPFDLTKKSRDPSFERLRIYGRNLR